MSAAIENLQAAMARAFAGRPRAGGFPYLAETLRQAGVTRNLWYLPACQSLYLTNDGPVVTMGTPLASGTTDVPPFDPEALIKALRTDQAGNSTFPEFLEASWRAGVVRYAHSRLLWGPRLTIRRGVSRRRGEIAATVFTIPGHKDGNSYSLK